MTTVNGQSSQENENSAQEEGQTEQEGEAEKSQTDNGQKAADIQGEEQKEEEISGTEGSEQETSSPAHETYTILQGDTITRISIKNYGSTDMIDEICQLNHLSEEDIIYPGQKILLP